MPPGESRWERIARALLGLDKRRERQTNGRTDASYQTLRLPLDAASVNNQYTIVGHHGVTAKLIQIGQRHANDSSIYRHNTVLNISEIYEEVRLGIIRLLQVQSIRVLILQRTCGRPSSVVAGSVKNIISTIHRGVVESRRLSENKINSKKPAHGSTWVSPQTASRWVQPFLHNLPLYAQHTGRQIDRQTRIHRDTQTTLRAISVALGIACRRYAA